jgi:hypothetical protein
MSNIIALKGVCENLKSQKTSVKTAYKISKILNAVEKEFEFYQTKFAEIVNEYSEKDENGQPVLINDGQGVKIQPDKISEAQIKMIELEAIEVELIISPLTLDELEGLEISISDMQTLSYIIEE